VKATQRSVAGLVTYANFITLTPGTVAVNVDENENEILVHALTNDFGDGLSDPEMDARVSGLEAGGAS
jgi:multicomponent Na+:H+ antiporter subunit E